ncbi:MAG: HupE/UreJ family protein [Betaproteobacteria bacterium]
MFQFGQMKGSGSIYPVCRADSRLDQGPDERTANAPKKEAGGDRASRREVGLPESDIPLPVLAFNVGMEIGQLLFIASLLTAMAALRNSLQWLPVWHGAYWCTQLEQLRSTQKIGRVAGFVLI